MKDHGYCCDILSSGSYVSVRWQHTLWGAIRGLEKNGFAVLHFSVPRLLNMTVTLIAGIAIPYAAPFLFPDWRASGYIATLLVMHVTYGYLSWKMARSYWLWPVFPVALLLTQFAFVRSGWVTLRQGGVRWRDTFYPLDILKANVYRSPSSP